MPVSEQVTELHHTEVWKNIFPRRQIGDYLIMRMHFVFYDYEKGIFPFLLDYLAVMILIAFIGYYSGVFLKKTGKRKRKGSY